MYTLGGIRRKHCQGGVSGLHEGFSRRFRGEELPHKIDTSSGNHVEAQAVEACGLDNLSRTGAFRFDD